MAIVRIAGVEGTARISASICFLVVPRCSRMKAVITAGAKNSTSSGTVIGSAMAGIHDSTIATKAHKASTVSTSPHHFTPMTVGRQ